MKQGMKESYEEGVAIHSAPSLRRRRPKRKQGYRWAGYRASKMRDQDAGAVHLPEGNMLKGGSVSTWAVPHSRRPRTRLEASCTEPGDLGGACRGVPWQAGGEKAIDARLRVSDSGAVPANHSNKEPFAESEEGRPLIKENTHHPARTRLRARAPGVGGCAQGSEGKEEDEVHRFAPPSDG
jgi:hypothetical protein